MEEEPFPEFRKRARLLLTSQEEIGAQGMEPDHMQAKVMTLEALFCKLCVHSMGIRLEFGISTWQRWSEESNLEANQ